MSTNTMPTAHAGKRAGYCDHDGRRCTDWLECGLRKAEACTNFHQRTARGETCGRCTREGECEFRCFWRDRPKAYKDIHPHTKTRTHEESLTTEHTDFHGKERERNG